MKNQIKNIKSRSILYDLAETGTATKNSLQKYSMKKIFFLTPTYWLIKYLLEHTKSETV